MATIEPNNPVTLRNIARSYGITGNYQEAIKYLDKSLEIEPGNADALYDLPVDSKSLVWILIPVLGLGLTCHKDTNVTSEEE